METYIDGQDIRTISNKYFWSIIKKNVTWKTKKSIEVTIDTEGKTYAPKEGSYARWTNVENILFEKTGEKSMRVTFTTKAVNIHKNGKEDKVDKNQVCEYVY